MQDLGSELHCHLAWGRWQEQRAPAIGATT